MDETTIDKIICNLDRNHALNNIEYKEYKKTLMDKLVMVKNLKEKKLRTLLCGDTHYSKYKYNQGISELFLYILFSQEKLKFQCEAEQNCDNNCNVDFSVKYNNISFNFEVKSPEYVEHDKEVISGRYAYRFGDKCMNEMILSNFHNELIPNINQFGYKNIFTDSITDNKIKDSLLSAQQKFSLPSKNNFNILFICTTTDEMIKYWQYFVNDKTGFFNQKSDINSFLNIDKQPLKRTDFNRINAIILSNGITLNERRNLDSWDISKAINLVLCNPFAKCQYNCSFGVLSEIFLHKTSEFVKFLNDEKGKDTNIPEYCHAYTFVSKNGFDINKEKQGGQTYDK